MYLYDDASAFDAPAAPPLPGRSPGYYGDGSPGVSARSIVRSWHLNLMMEELLAPVSAAGLAPSRTDATQLLQAIRLIAQGGVGNYAVDAGAVNGVVAVLTPTPVALVDGLVVRVKIAHTNTGAATLTVGGLNTWPIYRSGQGLNPGDLRAGVIAEFLWQDDHFDLQSPATLPKTLVQSGYWAGGDAAGPKAILFDTPYAAGVMPNVTLSVIIASPAGVDTAQLDSAPTNTGFIVNRRNYVAGTTSATNAPFLWRAEGPAPG